jgi:peptidoglycan/LPS O-acetylase OafA/YrhL
VGMILIKYRRIICNKIVFLIALIIDLVLYFVPVTCGAGIVFEMLFGIAFFVVLYNVGNIIIKGKALNNFFRFIGSISYQIFLLQHVIILKVFNIYNPSNNRDYWLVLGFTIMLTIGCSFVLQKLTSFVMRSSVVKDFESNVLKIGR